MSEVCFTKLHSHLLIYRRQYVCKSPRRVVYSLLLCYLQKPFSCEMPHITNQFLLLKTTKDTDSHCQSKKNVQSTNCMQTKSPLIVNANQKLVGDLFEMKLPQGQRKIKKYQLYVLLLSTANVEILLSQEYFQVLKKLNALLIYIPRSAFKIHIKDTQAHKKAF